MNRRHRIVALLLALPGLAVPFLPFTFNVSPVDTLLSWKRGRELALLGAPFFIAIPIAIWQARRLWADRLLSSEIACAYVLSIGAMLSVLAFTIQSLKGKNLVWDVELLVIYGTCWALLIANTALLVYNRSLRLGQEGAAEAFLLGGYLPNAALCLIGFGWNNLGVLQLGALVASIACAGYVVSIGLALRAKNRVAPSASNKPSVSHR